MTLKFRLLPSFRTRLSGLLVLTLLFSVTSTLAQAGTIVRVSTSVGDYSIELLDEEAPITVQNFLGYVNSDAYNGTYLHRVVTDFVVQGGGYRFQPFVGPIDVVAGPSIVNEFGASNLRGTVAMAKLEGLPDSATHEWFVNLSDNISLDTNSGGFTVFGRVLGNGMAVLDAIDDLPKINLGVKASDAPFLAAAYNDPRDFVYINVEVVERFSESAHVYETNSGLLITSVSVNADEEILSLNFNTVTATPTLQIQANLNSVLRRRDSFVGIASYSTTYDRLRIPVLEVTQGDEVLLFTNVVFLLTDAESSIFTLESYDQ